MKRECPPFSTNSARTTGRRDSGRLQVECAAGIAPESPAEFAGMRGHEEEAAVVPRFP
jgi:hypothetical protein